MKDLQHDNKIYHIFSSRKIRLITPGFDPSFLPWIILLL